jgi:hypothetical protein
MRKKTVIVSYLSEHLPGRSTKRILLSRETIRTLTSKELSRIVGGNCPTDVSSISNQDDGG